MSTVPPLVVNLFGGPNAGKSSLAPLIYGEIKCEHPHLRTELATEFAKDLVWEGRMTAIHNQLFVLGGQSQRIEIRAGKTDVIITDSPVLLSSVYRGIDYPPEFDMVCLWAHRRYPSLNILLERPAGIFESQGRIHDKEQSVAKDAEIRGLLERNRIAYVAARPDIQDARRIARMIADIRARAILKAQDDTTVLQPVA